MMIKEEDVLKVLSNVMDPDLGKDLVTLGMIQDLNIAETKIAFSVVLTTPACPLKEMLRKDCLDAIDSLGLDGIEVEINMTSTVTSSRTENLPILPNVKNLIAVASGKGGVGKSTVTSNLAVALARTGAKVGVVDADIFGPSIPTMFGCEGMQPTVKKVDDKTWIIPIEKYGVKLISIGFLSPGDNAIVWRGPMASSALKQFISDTDWGELDYLLFDLPPGTSDIHLTLVQTIPVTGAIVITTPQKVALADAAKGVSMFRQPQINVPILGIIENMAYFTPAELPENKYYIFGKDGGKELARQSDVEFLGEIPLVQSIRESGDNGEPVALKDEATAEAFMSLAKNLAQQIAIRNASQEKTKVVEVNQ
ncbi:MAG: Mrp/NBP35 family ATP-binding protein [Cyclobacteriaceae bacterium]|nr:Mrp/NBP35 family ATP-binding protein [Cyclobacteriaceae bacterium]